jgi:hypothetical protein
MQDPYQERQIFTKKQTWTFPNRQQAIASADY